MYGAHSEQKMLQMFYWETLQNPVIDLSSPNYRTINQKIDFLPFRGFLTLTASQYFQTLRLIILWSPREPGTTGVSILSFYCPDVLRQPLWNHHEHQYTGTPWGSSGDNRLSDISYEYHLAAHKNSHISTFIRQHRLDCRHCIAEDWTDILRLRKIYILFEIFCCWELFRASLQPRGEKCNS